MPLACNAKACSRTNGKSTKIHPRRWQSKSFKRSSYNWTHNAVGILSYFITSNSLIEINLIRLPTTVGFAGRAALNLLGISRRSSSGSMITALTFFCNIFARVWRPDAGGPRMIIFGATKRNTDREKTKINNKSTNHRNLSSRTRSDTPVDPPVDQPTTTKYIARMKCSVRLIGEDFLLLERDRIAHVSQKR